jgi:hypothetical protein
MVRGSSTRPRGCAVPSAASWPSRSFAARKLSRMILARCPAKISGLFRVYTDRMVRPNRRFLSGWVSDQLLLSQFTRLARCPAISSSLGRDFQWTGWSVPGTERSLLARFRVTSGLLKRTGFTFRGRALSAGEAAFSGTGSGCRVAAFVGAVFSGPRAPNPLASVGGGWRGSIPRLFWRAGPSGALTS